MQWTAGPGAGFTTGRPWLRIAADADRRNVAVQAADPDSVLAAYRRLLAFRRTAPALQSGSMARLPNPVPDVLAWTRSGEGQHLLVVVNFAPAARRVDVRGFGDGRWLAKVGTHREPASPDGDGLLFLRPDEAVILEAVGR
jgi:glycosidase